VFQGQDIPGLTTGATMIATTASIQRNTTDHPDLPASGGIQRFEVSLNEGRSGGDFSYWRYGLELKQFLPLSEDRRKVLGLRASLETNQPKGGSAVPFFDLPTIGSRSTVRGFSTRRFSDRSAMSAGVEYRYRIWRYFDWGVFVDAGQVAPEIGNFAMDRFHAGYGMRFIPRSQEGRGIIVDFARSREGWRFYVDFSPLF
jgi:outer membrane protein assembly factor BamA